MFLTFNLDTQMNRISLIGYDLKRQERKDSSLWLFDKKTMASEPLRYLQISVSACFFLKKYKINGLLKLYL